MHYLLSAAAVRQFLVCALVAVFALACSTTATKMKVENGTTWRESEIFFEALYIYCLAASAAQVSLAERAEEREIADDSQVPAFLLWLFQGLEKLGHKLGEQIDEQIASEVLEQIRHEHDLLCDLFSVSRDVELAVDVYPLALQITWPAEVQEIEATDLWCTLDWDTMQIARASRRHPDSFRLSRSVKQGISRPEALLMLDIVFSPPCVREVSDCDSKTAAVFKQRRKLFLTRHDDDVWIIVRDIRQE